MVKKLNLDQPVDATTPPQQIEILKHMNALVSFIEEKLQPEMKEMERKVQQAKFKNPRFVTE
jgi:hypothetical protein